MKKIMTLSALACLAFAMGCNNSQKTASPGAMSDSKSNCCSGDKAACTDKSSTSSNMGAVSDKNCSDKCTSGAKCPVTGKSADGTNMGAVSDTKSECCKGHG